jgi:predicted Zn finger-like uncharacterized protein
VIFTCPRCAKRYTLADAKVPPRGFRCTCAACGHAFVVGPVAPPPIPTRSSPPAPPPLPEPIEPLAPRVAPAPEPHQWLEQPENTDRFFASAPGSHQPDAVHGQGAPSAAARTSGSGRRLALGAVAVAASLALGLWWARSGGEVAAPAVAVVAALPPQAAAAEKVVAVAATPPGALLTEPSSVPRGAPAIPARVPGSTASPDSIHRAGAPITRRDRKLLDLLQRKEDVKAVPATLAGEPATRRTTLDTGRASLDEAAIRDTLAASSGAFSSCITRTGKADLGLRRDTRAPVLELVVRPTGRVSRATLADPAWNSSALGQCLTAAARRMVFPAFEGEEIQVEAPLKLTAVQ